MNTARHGQRLLIRLRGDLAGSTTALRLDAFLRDTADPQPPLEKLLQIHPDHIGAHVLRAGIAVAAKTPRSLKDLRGALDAANRIGGAVSAGDRAHLEAAHAWLKGCPLLAAERYSQIVRQAPLDLLALRLAQSSWFFLGRGCGDARCRSPRSAVVGLADAGLRQRALAGRIRPRRGRRFRCRRDAGPPGHRHRAAITRRDPCARTRPVCPEALRGRGALDARAQSRLVAREPPEAAQRVAPRPVRARSRLTAPRCQGPRGHYSSSGSRRCQPG